MPTRTRKSYSIQAVDNALSVLEALCDEGDEIGISRLSQRLGMNKTSVFRLLATFENRGYVEREASSGKYRLGLSAYEIARKLLSHMGLLSKARPVMERLARESSEAVYLAVRRDASVLFFDMVDTPLQVKIVSLVGKRVALAETAAGRAILAFSSQQAPAADPARRQPTDPLLTDLEDIRRGAAAADRDVLGEGIATLAVPLFGAATEAQGSLCIVAPSFRLAGEEKKTELASRLREAGSIISSKLGFCGAYPRPQCS